MKTLILALIASVAFPITAYANYFLVFPTSNVELPPDQPSVDEDSPISDYLEMAFIPHQGDGPTLRNIVDGIQYGSGDPITWNGDGSITVSTDQQFLTSVPFDFETDSAIIIVDLYFGRHISQTSRHFLMGWKDLVGSNLHMQLGEYGNGVVYYLRSGYNEIMNNNASRSNFGADYEARHEFAVMYDAGTRNGAYYVNGAEALTGTPLAAGKGKAMTDLRFSFGSVEERFYRSFAFVKRNGSFTAAEKSAILNSPETAIKN